jgi:lysozyme
MKFSNNGIEHLKTLEGFRAKPYADSGGKMTVGYGHLIVPGDGVGGNGDIIDAVKATQLLSDDVKRTVDGVNAAVTSTINQNQFDALVLFAYNVGVTAFKNSTLLKLLNTGDLVGASEQFLRWDRVGGVSVPGLHNRRVAEQTLFLTPI